MEPPKSDPPKLPDMVMCGDHPSVTKTELNARDPQLDPNQKEPRELTRKSYTLLLPTSSRTERSERPERSERAERLERSRALSEHALRATRRRVCSAETLPRVDEERGNGALVQAALGSFRWPPYLVCVWVLALLVTHALHCVAALLQRSLPPLRKFCQYFRTWTEESWKTDTELNHRIYPMSLACVTGLLYTMYFGLNLIYCIALWSIEPLSSEIDEKQSISEIEPKVTNYMDEVNSKINFSIKQ